MRPQDNGTLAEGWGQLSSPSFPASVSPPLAAYSSLSIPSIPPVAGDKTTVFSPNFEARSGLTNPPAVNSAPTGAPGSGDSTPASPEPSTFFGKLKTNYGKAAPGGPGVGACQGRRRRRRRRRRRAGQPDTSGSTRPALPQHPAPAPPQALGGGSPQPPPGAMGIQGMELCAVAVVILLFIAVLKQFGILEPISSAGPGGSSSGQKAARESSAPWEYGKPFGMQHPRCSGLRWVWGSGGGFRSGGVSKGPSLPGGLSWKTVAMPTWSSLRSGTNPRGWSSCRLGPSSPRLSFNPSTVASRT